MARMTLTSDMARAAAQDAANRQMRKAGRTKWSRADYNLAVRTFDRLWPKDKANPGKRVARRVAAKASLSRRSQPRDKKGRFIKRRARR